MLSNLPKFTLAVFERHNQFFKDFKEFIVHRVAEFANQSPKP